MGWGTRIALFYGSFVALMLFMVYMAFQEDFDLVADDYYEQEIAYQERIDQMTNANSDGQKVIITKGNDGYQLSFSEKAEEVKVHFFRPSDDTKDVLLEEAAVESILAVPSSQLIAGKYLVKVEWKANGKTYFQEDDLFVN
jgi:nitrogen fixation protein FixH